MLAGLLTNRRRILIVSKEVVIDLPALPIKEASTECLRWEVGVFVEVSKAELEDINHLYAHLVLCGSQFLRFHQPPPPAIAQPRRAGPWTEYLNHPDGRYYYHNSQTGRTQWEVPFEVGLFEVCHQKGVDLSVSKYGSTSASSATATTSEWRISGR